MDGHVLRSTAPKNGMTDVSVTLPAPKHDHKAAALIVELESNSAFIS